MQSIAIATGASQRIRRVTNRVFFESPSAFGKHHFGLVGQMTGHEKPAIQCVRFHVFRVVGACRCSVLQRNAVDQSTPLLRNFFDLLAIAVPLIAHPCLTKLVNRGADVIKLGSRHVSGKPICDAVRVLAEQ